MLGPLCKLVSVPPSPAPNKRSSVQALVRTLEVYWDLGAAEALPCTQPGFLIGTTCFGLVFSKMKAGQALVNSV